MAASPMDTVASLWGGELPVFDSLDSAKELLRVLVMGFWNQLARHQERNALFPLLRIDIPATREGLARRALIRRHEVVGFIQGLFGKEQGLALPQRARYALEAMAEAGGLYEFASNPAKPVSADDIAQLHRPAATFAS
jgi:hypothetical protein